MPNKTPEPGKKRTKTLSLNREERRINFLTHLVLCTASFMVVFPLLFALIKATQPVDKIFSPSLIPGGELLVNLKKAVIDQTMGLFILNSLKISFLVTLGKSITALSAAMVLVYFRFPFKKLLFSLIIITLIMPTEVLILGLYNLISLSPPETAQDWMHLLTHPLELLYKPIRHGLGLANTTSALVLPFLASATGIFLFRQHFLSIPSILGDAALCDGAGPRQFFFHILLPLSYNTIGAFWLIQFIYVWDQYLWPRVIIRREARQMVQVGLSLLMTANEGRDWGTVMAGAVFIVLPPLLIFILLQKQFVKGFALKVDK